MCGSMQRGGTRTNGRPSVGVSSSCAGEVALFLNSENGVRNRARCRHPAMPLPHPGVPIACQGMEAAGKESQKFTGPGVWGRCQLQPSDGSDQLLLSDRQRLLKEEIFLSTFSLQFWCSAWGIGLLNLPTPREF